MSGSLPDPFREVVELLARLPGLGNKSATRMALSLLKWPDSETRRLGTAIASLRDTLTLCSRCGAITATDPCSICSNPDRDRQLLCIVPEWDSLMALENGHFYNGLYFVLGGLLSPQRKTDAQTLEVDKLLARLDEGEVREIILALGATLEAENTASYIKGIVERKYPDLPITRLAQGIPLGGEVKHMDRETLRQSLWHRQKL